MPGRSPSDRAPTAAPVPTSGSTRPPKGIIHSHGDMTGIYASARWALDLKPGDVLWTDADPEVREAALKLHDQFQAFFRDILDQGYIIRAKAQGGEVYIPYLGDTGTIDDFASLVEYEEFVPNAECNAKLAVALIATGDPQENDCEDGISEVYEEVALIRYYGHTWMQWGFHVSALITAILYGAEGTKALLEGLGARMDELLTQGVTVPGCDSSMGTLTDVSNMLSGKEALPLPYSP